MEKEVKINLIPKEWIGEEHDMYRITCDGRETGWGLTLLEAIDDFDIRNR